MSNCDIFTPDLWRLLVMSLTVIFEVYFTALTMILSSTAVLLAGLFNAGWVEHQWFLFFFSTFPFVILSMGKACAVGFSFFSFLFLNCTFFTHRQISSLHVGLSGCFIYRGSIHRGYQEIKPRGDLTSNCSNNQSNRPYRQQFMCSNIF